MIRLIVTLILCSGCVQPMKQPPDAAVIGVPGYEQEPRPGPVDDEEPDAMDNQSREDQPRARGVDARLREQ